MKLLISHLPRTTIWEYKDGSAKVIDFETFDEEELCPATDLRVSMKLPCEIQLMVVKHLLDLYLVTRNFDLCIDLLFVSRSVALYMYRSIFGLSNQPLSVKIGRLVKVFTICQNIHDLYITERPRHLYSCVGLGRSVSSKPLAIWDFYEDCSVKEVMGLIYDSEPEIQQINLGSTYGSNVWLSGEWGERFFDCTYIQTPIISIILYDSHATLLASVSNIRNNRSINCFAKLLRKIYGPLTAVNFMIRDNEYDLENPFITASTTFFSF